MWEVREVEGAKSLRLCGRHEEKEEKVGGEGTGGNREGDFCDPPFEMSSDIS